MLKLILKNLSTFARGVKAGVKNVRKGVKSLWVNNQWLTYYSRKVTNIKLFLKLSNGELLDLIVLT